MLAFIHGTQPRSWVMICSHVALLHLCIWIHISGQPNPTFPCNHMLPMSHVSSLYACMHTHTHALVQKPATIHHRAPPPNPTPTTHAMHATSTRFSPPYPSFVLVFFVTFVSSSSCHRFFWGRSVFWHVALFLYCFRQEHWDDGLTTMASSIVCRVEPGSVIRCVVTHEQWGWETYGIWH